MSQRLAGKVVIVTGGASGIGRGTAKLLAAEGAKVVIADIAESQAAAAATEIGDDRCIFIRTDVSREADVCACIGAARAHFDGVDCLVNGAVGSTTFGPIEELPLEAYRRDMDILLTGPFLAIKHVVPEFKIRGQGAIVNIISLAGLFGVGIGITYTTAKHGLLGLTRAAADQLAPFNIRVNAVAPGWIVTPLHSRQFEETVDAATRVKILRNQFTKKQPLRRAGEPEDIAEAVAYLLSDGARFVTGQTVVVDGGLSAVTRAFDEVRSE